jgi:hypothetical protein
MDRPALDSRGARPTAGGAGREPYGSLHRDGEFRATVDRYIGDFERLLRDAEQNDPSVMQNYMTSETGRVYLLLAHASGRLH